jgi:hypothetical protein
VLSQLANDDRPLRKQLGEWQKRLRASRERAQRTQAEINAKIQGRRERERRERVMTGVAERRAIREELPPEFVPVGDVVRLPPPLPEMSVRPHRPLTPEETALRELSDEAQQLFNAQLFVVQPR